MAGPQELVRLDLPARPTYVGIARSVVTSVAGGIDGLDDDRLDDLQLAVSEACTSAVSAGDVGRMTIRCTRDGSRLEVSIEDAGPTAAGVRLARDDLARQLLTALVDDLVVEEGDRGNAVRLFLDLGAGPRPD
jgi:anti-sigma regulatory factor (Ser/Thr protein kinase)